MLRRALAAKKFTLMRFQDTFQNFSALRGLWVGYADAGNLEALFGVELGVFVVDAQSRLRNESQTAPLEIWAQLKNFSHGAKRSPVAFPGDDALVLIFNFGFARS
jgi:DNA-binding transcriptional regulator of glucitol operon